MPDFTHNLQFRILNPDTSVVSNPDITDAVYTYLADRNIKRIIHSEQLKFLAKVTWNRVPLQPPKSLVMGDLFTVSSHSDTGLIELMRVEMRYIETELKLVFPGDWHIYFYISRCTAYRPGLNVLSSEKLDT